MADANRANDKKKFNEWMEENYPDIPKTTMERILVFGELVAEAGDRMQLVSRGDVGRVFMRHVREALAPALVKELPAGARLVDIGSGGGFPGIPLALLREDLTVGLVEPRHRKGAFLERTVLQLGLKNVEVYTASLDALVQGNPELRFGIAVSRGLGWTPPMVKRLETLLDPTGPLLRFGSPGFEYPGVQVAPIDSDTPRAVQVWPRETWEGLPQAG